MPVDVTEEFKKHCTTCGVLKWFHEFHRDEEKSDGMRDQCKVCRNRTLAKRKERRRIALMARRQKQQQEHGYDVLEQLADAGGKTDPHISEMTETVLAVFGGEQGYAKWLFSDFLAAKPGSTSRVKLHQMIVSMISKTSELGLAEQQLELASAKDLMKIIQEAAGDEGAVILEGAVKDSVARLEKSNGSS